MPRFLYRLQLHTGLSAAALVATSVLSAQELTPEEYDWVPLEQLSAKQSALIQGACKGLYVDPLASTDPPSGQATPSSDTYPIQIDADYTHMSSDSIHLKGDVDVSQGPRRIEADEMVFDRETQRAALQGKVQVRQKGLLLRGEKAEVDMASEQAAFEEGEFVMHEEHLRGRAGSISHRSDGHIVLENGSFTSCEPGHESWVLEGHNITIDPLKQRGTGRDIKIKVAGVPVMYLPYIVFPVGNARQSGFLFPSVRSSEGGLDLAVPYYWNLAPNYDATLTPRYAAGHGAMLESEFRYMNRVSHNTFAFGYLPDDEGGGDPDLEAVLNDPNDTLRQKALRRIYDGEDRWLARFQHTGMLFDRLDTEVDYTRTSDVDYFRDLSAASFDTINNTFLSQSAQVRYELPNWQLRARLQTFQNLLLDLPDNYRQLPRVHVDGRYNWNRWNLGLRHEAVQFTHADNTFIIGNRFNLDYELTWDERWQWGFLSPSVGIRGLAYNLDEDNLAPGIDDTPALMAPYATLDAGLIFERNGGRQTLEPRVYYLYRAHRDHSDLFDIGVNSNAALNTINFDTTPLTFGYNQLFRSRRFAGGDRIGDANQLTLGLTSRWYNRRGDREQLSVSVGQVVYFDDQRVALQPSAEVEALDRSDLAIQARTELIENLSIQGDLLYNPDSDSLIRTAARVSYAKDDFLFNIGHRFVRENSQDLSTLPIDQLDTSFAVPFAQQWKLVGRAFYDLDKGRELDTFIGFEYDDCC